MPAGVEYQIVYDPTQFVRSSIEAVIHTLLEAIALVVLVVIVFLQTWRASIIPLLAVPVSIVGTFSLLLAFGFSINALSLFGMVLAIGIVVDDAIVVVENVERNIEAGCRAREATYQAMREVSGPIIAIALTLVAVFVPLAFMIGPDGPVLQAVRDDHRHLDGDLRVQLADPVAGARRDAAEGPRRAEGLAHARDGPRVRRLLQAFNKVFHRGSEAYGKGVTGVITPQGVDDGRLCRAARRRGADRARSCRAASCRRRTRSI